VDFRSKEVNVSSGEIIPKLYHHGQWGTRISFTTQGESRQAMENTKFEFGFRFLMIEFIVFAPFSGLPLCGRSVHSYGALSYKQVNKRRLL